MGSSSQTSTGSSQTQIDPQLKANYLGNYGDAQKAKDFIRSTGPYTGDRVADQTWAAGQQGQTLAQQGHMFTDPNVMNTDMPGYLSRDAGNYLTQAATTPWQQASGFGYDPSQFQAKAASMTPAQASIYGIDRAGIRDVNPYAIDRSAVRDTGFDNILPYLGDYQNPYTDGVINQGLSDLDRSRQMTQDENSASAIRNHAFGGSRQGVVEAETNRGFADASQRFVADQRSQGYDRAVSAAQTDLARRQAAQGANQQADLGMAGLFQNSWLDAQKSNQDVDWRAAAASQAAANGGSQFNTANAQAAAQHNADLSQQAGLANQGMFNDASKFNAQSAQQADLANQSAGFQNNSQLLQASQLAQVLAGQQFAMPLQYQQALQGYDTYQRQLQQDQINAQMQQWDDLRYQELPGLQLQAAALGLQLPNLGMSSSGTQKTSYNPSGLQTVGQIAQIAGNFI